MGIREGIIQTNYRDDSLLKFEFPVNYNDSYTSTFDQTSGIVIQTVRKGSLFQCLQVAGRVVLHLDAKDLDGVKAHFRRQINASWDRELGIVPISPEGIGGNGDSIGNEVRRRHRVGIR